MFDESSQQCCQLPRARKSKLASGYTLIRITFPFQDTFHHFRTTWLIFLCSKISSFDVRRIQPTPKSSKVEIGFWLHSNKNSFYLDLYPCLGPMQRPHSMRGTRIGLGLCLSAMRRGTARAARRSHPTIGRSPPPRAARGAPRRW